MRNIIYDLPSDPQNARNHEVIAIATGCLVNQGWLKADGAAFATKEIMTAAGGRSASAYLADGGEKSLNYAMSADYQSEGRNVLESLWKQIPKDADDESIRHAVSEFLNQADTKVAQTYAVRLYRQERPVAEQSGEEADVQTPAPC